MVSESTSAYALATHPNSRFLHWAAVTEADVLGRSAKYSVQYLRTRCRKDLFTTTSITWTYGVACLGMRTKCIEGNSVAVDNSTYGWMWHGAWSCRKMPT